MINIGNPVPPPPKRPSIGRIVHFRIVGDCVRPAIITKVRCEYQSVDLHVFGLQVLGANMMPQGVKWSAGATVERTWDWPPKE